MPTLPAPLAAMEQYAQFILWRAEWNEEKKKWEKRPQHPTTLLNHNPLDPEIWLPADKAVKRATDLGGNYGFGFVFTDSDPFWFLDIDNCFVDGQWSELSKQLLSFFPGAAVEVSYSGKGLHVFGTGAPPAHGCKNKKLDLEFYHADRFVALTCGGIMGDASTDHTASLAQVIPFYFPQGATIDGSEWTTEPVSEYGGPENDDELINKILNSRGSADAVFSGRATVVDLWNANEEKLAETYPDGFGSRAYDASDADAALCQHLAFWTGKNCERIDRLFRRSGLYRDKWERDDYREGTILKAVGLCSAVYTGRNKPAQDKYAEADSITPAEPTITDSPEIIYRSGLQYLSPTNQAELFKGCVYVQDLHRMFTPDGCMLRPDRVKATYGGYIFALDSTNDKTTTDAWKAFTESQAVRFPRAHSTCFRPELPPGKLIKEAQTVRVNTYVPIRTQSAPGDVTPYLNHVELLFPDPGDRAIIEAYIAAVVQYKGSKFQWSPLIQGIEGNGKSLFIRAVEAAVGQKYTHLPNSAELGKSGSTFNAWIQGKIFIGVEEIYISDRREVSEALKPLITNDRIEIQGKGDNQITGDNRANFIMCTNHKGAIFKNDKDRRYAIFYTAQQTPEDLFLAGMVKADGVTPTEYFPRLYNWLKSGGYANVTHYLENYEIPEQLNPAGLCCRAPVTSSTAEALKIGLGGIEQEIIEAIEQGLPGFAGGWISSMALDRMLKARRDDKRIPHNKRHELLGQLGYVPHPSLKDGRANIIIPFDGGKPRLYVKQGSIQARMRPHEPIIPTYIKAQEKARTTNMEGITATEAFSK